MAEALLKKIVSDNGFSDSITVSSAGLAATNDSPAAHNAIEVMKEHGLNLQDHKSRKINSDILKADLIITMTNRHKQMLVSFNNDLKDKTFTLKEYAGELHDLDIIDPYGGSIQIYRDTATEINKYLQKIWQKKLKNII